MTTSMPARSNATPAPISPEEFRTGNAISLYSRLRPDQRAAISLEFLRLLRLSGDPQVAALGGGAVSETDADKTDTNIATRLMQHEPQPAPTVTAEQTARIHAYVLERHPDLFEQALNHPVTRASLATPGADPVESSDQPEVKLPPADIPRTSTALDHPAP